MYMKLIYAESSIEFKVCATKSWFSCSKAAMQIKSGLLNGHFYVTST